MAIWLTSCADAQRDRPLSSLKARELLAQFRDRDRHFMKKALAIAVLAIERHPGGFSLVADRAAMKTLLDRVVVASDVELEPYVCAARIAVDICARDFKGSPR